MKIWGLLLVLSCLNARAYEYTRIPCDAHFEQVTWQHLILNEKAIAEAYQLIAIHSGTTKPTNCSVEYPTQGGVAVDGPRRVTLDNQWYAIVKKADGSEERVFRHEGIKVEYTLAQGVTGKLRDVSGFSVCRTPTMCQKLGIPFGGSTFPTEPGPSVPPGPSK